MGSALVGGFMEGAADARKQSVMNAYYDALKKKTLSDIDLHKMQMDAYNALPEDQRNMALVGIKVDPLEQMIINALQGKSGPGAGAAPAGLSAGMPGMNPSGAAPGGMLPGMLSGPQDPVHGELADYWARYHGLPEKGMGENIFRRLIGSESAWNPQAVSPKGAVGLGQLMPGTAGELGVTNPRDPSQNLSGSAQYMSQMLAKFKDLPSAIAAYNAGPAGNLMGQEPQGLVRKVLGSQGAPAQAQPMPQPGGAGGFTLDQSKFIQGYLNKKFGYPEDEYTWRSFAGPTGIPMTGAFNKRTNQLDPKSVMPEAVKAEFVEQEQPGGAKQKIGINPYNMTPIGGGGPLMNGQPAIQQGIIPTAPPQGEKSGEAGRQQLAQTGIEALNQFKGLVFNQDGTLNNVNLMNSWANTPKTEGRRLSQLAENAIDAVIRAATGAALNQQEMKEYSRRYVPSPFDNEATIKAKVQQLDSFLNGYLEKMDPTGAQRLRTGLPGPAVSQQLKTASDFLKAKGLQ